MEQRRSPEKICWCDPCYYEAGVGLGYDETRQIVDMLVEDGVLLRNDKGQVALADSESVRYDFNI